MPYSRSLDLNSTVRKLRKRKDVYDEAIQDGLEAAAKKLLAYSQEIVPVDTGALKKSGRVEITGRGIKSDVRVVYGAKGDEANPGEADSATYAGVVHNDPGPAHGAVWNKIHAAEIGVSMNPRTHQLEHERRPQERFQFLRGPLLQHWMELRQTMISTARQWVLRAPVPKTAPTPVTPTPAPVTQPGLISRVASFVQNSVVAPVTRFIKRLWGGK